VVLPDPGKPVTTMTGPIMPSSSHLTPTSPHDPREVTHAIRPAGPDEKWAPSVGRIEDEVARR